MSTVAAAYALAGEVFEKQRHRGASHEMAMREAERTLRASVGPPLKPPEVAKPIPPFAHRLMELVAAHYRVSVKDMQLRGSKGAVRAAREEAAGVLVRAGLSPSQVGRLMRRDRYIAGPASRTLDERLAKDNVLHARIERFLTEALATQASPSEEKRRPPRRAETPSDIAPREVG